MKITVEFDLPTEEFEHKVFINSKENYFALHELFNAIRSYLKYTDVSDEEYRRLEEISQLIPDNIIMGE